MAPTLTAAESGQAAVVRQLDETIVLLQLTREIAANVCTEVAGARVESDTLRAIRSLLRSSGDPQA